MSLSSFDARLSRSFLSPLRLYLKTGNGNKPPKKSGPNNETGRPDVSSVSEKFKTFSFLSDFEKR
jgi:hypothetical protein